MRAPLKTALASWAPSINIIIIIIIIIEDNKVIPISLNFNAFFLGGNAVISVFVMHRNKIELSSLAMHVKLNLVHLLWTRAC